MATVELIPIDLIEPGAYQARADFDAHALNELALSISRSGLIQPVIVRSTVSGYELLAGERRWRAAQMAQLTEIAAIVRDDLSNEEASVLGLIENLQRESLNVTETARGLRALCEQFGLTHDEVASRIGKSRVYVTNYLRILRLADRVQAYLNDGSLTLGHGKVLAGVPLGLQKTLAEQAVAKRLSVRALEQLIAQPQRADPPARSEPHADVARLADEISDLLGNSATIHFDSDSQQGELAIKFHSLEEFAGILERLGLDWGDR